MGADASHAPRQGGTFLAHYVAFAEFLEELKALLLKPLGLFLKIDCSDSENPILARFL
jgi:hypothetical protein